MRATIFAVSCACLVLTACGSMPTKERDYPYFTSMPSAEDYNAQYTHYKHDLSPIEEYHFAISIPTGWEVLDLAVKQEPEPGAFTEMGVFRLPGAWMNDETIPPEAEIAVTLVNAVNEQRWASVWLKEIVEKNVPNMTMLEERTIRSHGDEAADLLFTYTDNGQKIVQRMAAFRSGTRFYVISASDTSNGYRDRAEAFYVAIASFAPENDQRINPFAEQD